MHLRVFPRVAAALEAARRHLPRYGGFPLDQGCARMEKNVRRVFSESWMELPVYRHTMSSIGASISMSGPGGLSPILHLQYFVLYQEEKAPRTPYLAPVGQLLGSLPPGCKRPPAPRGNLYLVREMRPVRRAEAGTREREKVNNHVCRPPPSLHRFVREHGGSSVGGYCHAKADPPEVSDHILETDTGSGMEPCRRKIMQHVQRVPLLRSQKKPDKMNEDRARFGIGEVP